jgi:hypothetical protein
MAECERLDECPFFNDRLLNMPPVAEAMKRRYCMRNYTQCARYIVKLSLGRRYVPADLFPNDIIRAKILVYNYI